MSAVWYLIWTSGRNRAFAGLRRARRPRYGLALAIGLLYVWAFLVRPTGATPIFAALLTQPAEMIVTLLLVLTLAGAWVFGSDRTALAFTPAEVSLLFPAPLTRGALIRYKLIRTQILVLANTLIWVFILRRGGTALPAPMRALGLWVLFSTLNLHRLGAALVRASWQEHGRVAARRHAWSTAAFALVAALVVVGLVSHRGELLRANDIGSFLEALGRVLAEPPALWGLFPFLLVVDPAFAQSVRAWTPAIAAALGILVLHAWWVLRTDAAFEDAAIEASAERARRLELRARRRTAAPPPRAPTRTLRLSPRGHPAVAIFWKNLLCLRRTAQLRVFVAPLAISIAIGAAMAAEIGGIVEAAAASAVVLAGTLVIFGGRMIRNDLRADMQHLPMLKSIPVAPTEIIVAEVLSSALPMAAVQFVLLLIAYVLVASSPFAPLTPSARTAILLSAPAALVALDVALLAIQNATAVLFPAWVRLGPSVHAGVEALGQNVLATGASLLVLALGLVLPLAIAGAVVSPFGVPGALSVVAATLIASVLLALETVVGMRVLGRAFGRAEPAETD